MRGSLFFLVLLTESVHPTMGISRALRARRADGFRQKDKSVLLRPLFGEAAPFFFEFGEADMTFFGLEETLIRPFAFDG